MCHVTMGGVTLPPNRNTGNITEDWYSMGKRETYIVCLTIGSGTRDVVLVNSL